MSQPEGTGELFLGVAAAELVRREIRRARGNEVCFLARVGEAGELVDVRPVARGNSGAVLAAIRDPEPGCVALHNHPSGLLEPSDADISVAAALWEQGVGFAITNNDASDLYVVVEPPSAQSLEPLDLGALSGALAPGGSIALAHPGYEDRPQQRALTRLIGELYNEGGIGIAEAGTGTGKSVAYLLPAIEWAIRNKERTVVSTNTINLQEQLVDKDLPFLRRALGQPFRFALVKGRSNYVSIRRARLAWETAASLFEDEKQGELKGIVEWLDTTQDGSLSDLSFRPSAEVWEEVVSDPDVCLRARCPHFTDCHYQRSRREAAKADILVANHHLLFSDLAVRRAQGNYSAPAVLPQYRRLILDEAHNLEEAATRYMGATISRRSLFRMLRRVEHRGKGILPTVRRVLERSKQDLLMQAAIDLIDRLQPALEGSRDRAARVFALLEDVVRSSSDPMLRMDDSFARHPIWSRGLQDELDGLLANLETLHRGLAALRERIAVEEEAKTALEPQIVELRGAANRIDGAALALRATLCPGPDNLQMVRWIEVRRDARGSEQNLSLSAAPLDLAAVLRESLLEKLPTVVMTSATLATQQDFRFLRERIGLTDDDPVREAIYASPFDFESQALLAIPTDLPIPTGENDRRFDEATARATIEHALITDGGLFVLFTSYRSLRSVAATLRSRGADAQWPLFVQGESPRAQLIARFIESGRGVLLGTTSFWEGVDVPGSPLRGLIIPKLPFKVPSEPVTAARIEAIEARGGNSFTSYMLPHAAIRLKQGFGRLIRSRGDHGAVLVLDSRIVRKSYGRYLLESLPPAPIVAAPWAEVREELARFYRINGTRPATRDPAPDLKAVEDAAIFA